MSKYFDSFATTPCHVEVLAAMLPYFQEDFANPSSGHTAGRQIQQVLQQARETIQTVLGAKNAKCIFTSGGTESISLALMGCAAYAPVKRLMISSIEHAAVNESARALSREGWEIIEVPVTDKGQVDLVALANAATGQPGLASFQMVNHEAGFIQPIDDMLAILKPLGWTVHVDAVQALGKLPIAFDGIDADLMSISAHKIYGPKGAGVLLAKPEVDFAPRQWGGGQEAGFRSGTENVPAIIGFAKAIEVLSTEYDARIEHVTACQQAFEHVIEIMGYTIIKGAVRVPHVSLVWVKQNAHQLSQYLGQKGFWVSQGSACAAGNIAPCRVVGAMGYPIQVAGEVLRISFGENNSLEDCINLANEIQCANSFAQSFEIQQQHEESIGQ